MNCYKCGRPLSEKNFCTSCGVDVGLYKKIIYTANRLYNDALDKATVRDLSGAITCLKQCLKLNRDHVEARNLLGLVYFERGEVVAALSEWVISKNIRPEKNIADDYIRVLQENPGRLDSFNQTIKKYNMALAYCQQDSTDLAIIQLKKVISMNPKFLEARQLLALLYINTQEWERARKELTRALRIDANNTTTLRYLKEVEEMQPSEEEHGKKKKEAIVYKSGNDTVIQPAGKKETAGLQAVMNIVIGVVLGVGIAYFLVLPARIRQAQEDANVRFAEVSELLDEKTVEADGLNAQIEALMREKEDLSDSLNAARGTGSALQADTDLIEAALLHLQDDGSEMEIAETLALIDRVYLEQEATESFRNLYYTIKNEIAETVAKKSYDAGSDALRAEDYDVAIENLERAVEYAPDDGEALYNLGNAYNRSGNTSLAIPIYEQVVEQFPNTEKARKSANYIKEIRGE